MNSIFNRRLFLGGLLSILTALPLCAQEAKSSTNYVLNVSLDHPNALYRPGETVTFEISLQHDKQPVNDAEVAWTLTKDGVAPTKSGKARLQNGKATVTGELAEPGFLHLLATYPVPSSKTSLTARGGAGIAPTQIKPSLPVPDDFDTFWKEQKAQLAKIPLAPKLTSVTSPAKGVECFDLQAPSIGAPVSGYYARPEGAKPKSLPIILTVHGAGVRSSSLGGTVNWAKQGFIAMDINAHGIANGQPDKFYSDLAAGELNDYRAKGRDSRETVYFLGMFLRLVRALDFLTAQPEWDGKTVVVSGSSQGGAQAIVAAGLDPRVTFIAAGVPAMCDHTGMQVGRVSGWPKIVPNGADGKPDPKVITAARYYDAMNFATRSKANGIFTVGFIDTTCPPTSVYAAYNNFAGKKEIFHDIKAGHTNTPKASEAMRDAILKHVAEQKK
jgi:cephalosporin-C deacetylase-like acetyl esterase